MDPGFAISEARLLAVHAFTIDAPGLFLSPPVPEDVDAVTSACQDPQIARWTTVPSPYTREDAQAFCSFLAPNGWQTGTQLTWAVRRSEQAEPIAMISLSSKPANSWDIGFWTARQARGQGVMTRAAAAVIEQAFDPRGPICAQRLEWRCEFDGELPNWASWRVAWRLGFHKQARLRAATAHRGVRRDMWLADLLPGEPREPERPWDGPVACPTSKGHGPVARPMDNAFEVPATPSDDDSSREGDRPEGLVRRFHRVYGLPVAEDAPSLDRDRVGLRMDLIAEEFGELFGAVYGPEARRIVDDAARSAKQADDRNRDLVGAADALADLVYVIYGMALETGIDLPAVLCEVQRSNMSKLGADGRPIYRADGKVLKGPDYRPPNLAAVLARTGTTGALGPVRPQS